MIYFTVKTLFNLIGRIPQKWSVALSHVLGQTLFLVDKRHREIALNNLTLAFGHEKSPNEIHMIARQVFKNLIQIVFEIGWSLHLDEKRWKEYFKIEGLTNIQNAFEKGKGVLALTAHLGNFELLTIIGAIIAYPISIVVRPLDFKPMDRFFMDLRTRHGAGIIKKRRSFRTILESLNQGEMVALLLDQNVDWYEGVFVDFFGRRACTNKGLALLAIKTKAPVVPEFLERHDSGFTAHFLPEIPLISTGDKTRDVEENTQQYNNVLESFVKQHVDQWFWIHQRWKTQAYHPWPREL